MIFVRVWIRRSGFGYHFFSNERFLVSQLEVTSVVNEKKSNAVARFAENHKIRLHKWPNQLDALTDFNLGIVCSFGQLIPNEIIKSFRMGVINIHSSLLPKYRGAAPIIHAIVNGDRIFGCSIMEVRTEKFDIGPIWAQKSIECDRNMKLPEINRTLAKLGADLMHECLLDFDFYRDNSRQQHPQCITYAPKINSSLSIIDWNLMSSDRVHNLDRALTGLYGLTAKWNQFVIKLYGCRPENAEQDKHSYNSGSFFVNKKLNRLFVYCCDRKFISFEKLSVNSKKIISANDFSNGYLKKTSESLFRFD